MTDTVIEFERRCPKCDETKPVTEFPRNRSRADGRAAYCRPCHAANLAEYRATERGQAAVLASQRRSLARRKAAYEAAVAALPPGDRARLGR